MNLTTALNAVPGEGDGEEREGEEGEEGRREEGGDCDEGEGQREEEDVQVEEAAGVGTSARLHLDGAETEGGGVRIFDVRKERRDEPKFFEQAVSRSKY